MTCAEIELLLCDYVEGGLDEASASAVRLHVAACPGCQETVEDCRSALALIERAAEVSPPPELVNRILFQIPGRRGAPNARGLRNWLRGWLAPVLQPRFAMGMAMTILSFSMLGRFAGINQRLEPADLKPANVIAAIDNHVHRTWTRVVKYYESLRFVYEIQTRLNEWSEQQDQELRRQKPGSSAEPSTGK